jgi:hypothetical protein
MRQDECGRSGGRNACECIGHRPRNRHRRSELRNLLIRFGETFGFHVILF